jgi:hypothetical protein
VAPERWLLKGGFALDLRLSNRARTTRDVDIDWQAAEDELFDALIDAAALDTDDFFAFEVVRTATPPERLGGSYRFRATAHLAGGSSRPFSSTSESRPIQSRSTTRSRHRIFWPSRASTRSRFRPRRSSGRSPRSSTPTRAAMATISRAPARET